MKIKYNRMKTELGYLFKKYTGNLPLQINEIPRSVSTREYFRMGDKNRTVVGTYSPDIRETRAFTTFAEIFRKSGIHVPEVYIVSDDLNCYLQEDLGDKTLNDFLVSRLTDVLNTELKRYYKLAIDQLSRLQVIGDEKIDYEICVPRPEFDHQSVLWDLYHFKYYFLKTSGLPFNEQKLEDAFQELASSVKVIESMGFMFRDFQSRNIMIKEGETYLIDFQGGRKGPLQYDLASLVFESGARMVEAERNELIDYYLETISQYRNIDKERFMKDFYLVALIRILQALGAYGLRGLVEKKAIFLQSIPFGLKNLQYILHNIRKSTIDPYLFELLYEVSELHSKFRHLPESFDGLTITIFSFSYRNNLPDDLYGNGGGVVYDCRFIENPGRDAELMQYTGLEQPVISFLENNSQVTVFYESVRSQLDMVITSYIKRNYNNLMVSFGCTGGRHRSVYMARKVADWLRGRGHLRVYEIHKELGVDF